MTASSSEFRQQTSELVSRIQSLSDRRIVLFGGKGGVGKTTLASLAAITYAAAKPTVLFTTDPASNLIDLFGTNAIPNLRIESVHAESLYREFLDENAQWFVEAADRGTYLDREEIERFLELSIPGIDELMSWRRIGVLSASTEEIIVVDTAPTGHTLRMLSSSNHFRQFAGALESMQGKHREIVQQLTHRRLYDDIDRHLETFSAEFRVTADRLRDAKQSAFVAVTLAEEWVVEQTMRLTAEIEMSGIAVPFVVLNQAVHDCDCPRCSAKRQSESAARDAMHGREVLAAPSACASVDSLEALQRYARGELAPSANGATTPPVETRSLEIAPRKLVFFCGKGGVGKTTTASSVALQLASRGDRVTLLSVDPAHSVRDVFAHEEPPSNLRVETIDTKRDWNALRERLGDEIERAINALTPSGLTLQHDKDVMKELLDLAPPGADEIFALVRIADLLVEEGIVIVDTAPTGHFLRLLDLPRSAGERVREFMRLLLKYRELVPAGSLGEELLKSSRALHRIDAALQSEEASAVVVSRAENIVIAETRRLLASLEERKLRVDGIIVNYLTPDTGCSCDSARRSSELEVVASIQQPFVAIERRDTAPVSLDALRQLVPLRQTVRK